MSVSGMVERISRETHTGLVDIPLRVRLKVRRKMKIRRAQILADGKYSPREIDQIEESVFAKLCLWEMGN